MVFARSVAGQELTFGVSGKLIMNAVVLYDHQTDTLWSQFLAQAVDGPLAGTKLELLPAEITTWEVWRERHPDTLALDKTGTLAISSYDPYTSYYSSRRAGILGESNSDERLLKKEFVVGLNDDRVQRAYPFRYLSDSPVLNDSYAGDPIVVGFVPDSATVAVFSRTVEGRLLTFDEAAGKVNGQLLMRDAETGTTWGRITGEALDGPLAGERLEQLPTFVAFWFAWTDFYPDTELYTPPGSTGEEGVVG